MDQMQTFVQIIEHYGINLSVCTCLHVRTGIVDMLVRLTWTKHKHSYRLTLTQERYMPSSRSSSNLYVDCLYYLQYIHTEHIILRMRSIYTHTYCMYKHISIHIHIVYPCIMYVLCRTATIWVNLMSSIRTFYIMI